MGIYDKYFKTYNPMDIPEEVIREDSIKSTKEATEAFFRYIQQSVNVKFNFERMYEPVVLRNNQTITYKNTYVTKITPDYLMEEGTAMASPNQAGVINVYPFFSHIVDTLNEQHNRMYGKYKFLIYAVHVTPVMNDETGNPMRGVFFQYVPLQHVA